MGDPSVGPQWNGMSPDPTTSAPLSAGRCRGADGRAGAAADAGSSTSARPMAISMWERAAVWKVERPLAPQPSVRRRSGRIPQARSCTLMVVHAHGPERLARLGRPRRARSPGSLQSTPRSSRARGSSRDCRQCGNGARVARPLRASSAYTIPLVAAHGTPDPRLPSAGPRPIRCRDLGGADARLPPDSGSSDAVIAFDPRHRQAALVDPALGRRSELRGRWI